MSQQVSFNDITLEIQNQNIDGMENIRNQLDNQ